MYTENFDQLVKLNKNLMTPLSEWNKVSMEIFSKISQQNLELMGENLSRLTAQLKRFSTVRRPEDFFNLQKDCINEDINMALENFQKMFQISMSGIEEFTQLLSTMRETTLSTLNKSTKTAEKELEKINR